MAIYLSCRSLCLCPLRLVPLKIIQPYLCSFLHESAEDNTGVLDDFTSQLMSKKASKWERKIELIQKKVKPNFLKTNNIKNLDIDNVNELFQTAIDHDDYSTIRNLTKHCIENDKIPSYNILLNILSLHSRMGDKNSIIQVSTLCEKIRPEILQENSNFQHYVAEAVWIKGDITKSLKIFETVYKENEFLRQIIRSKLRYLILNSVENHSEATLVNLIQFSEKLVQEYNDYFTLGCLWQACILSEWFTDQQIALEFLNKYTELCKIIARKIPLVVRISLKHHRTEIVYRLNEVLLKYEMDSEVSQVLLALLDYWIKQGDFRQCQEIVLWSIENDIEISTVSQNSQLLKLLVDNGKHIKIELDAPRRTRTDYKF
ncbi:unnamed protein product [Ceutorhynchus assimilis]|uniref:Uncharacterized protein n=1 Tax=Ceutorhynchus assimilis TaxID=467358 RepID=A0A9N9MF23_9CUCU|nr:unnamed protein product [Ceutorhynchus assimilis]